MKNSTLWDHTIVDLRARIVGQRHRTSPESAEKIFKKMKLQEIVEKNNHNKQKPQCVMRIGYHWDRLEEECVGINWVIHVGNRNQETDKRIEILENVRSICWWVLVSGL